MIPAIIQHPWWALGCLGLLLASAAWGPDALLFYWRIVDALSYGPPIG